MFVWCGLLLVVWDLVVWVVGLDSGLSMCGLGLYGLIELVGLCGRCVCVYGLLCGRGLGAVWWFLLVVGGFCWFGRFPGYFSSVWG